MKIRGREIREHLRKEVAIQGALTGRKWGGGDRIDSLKLQKEETVFVSIFP